MRPVCFRPSFETRRPFRRRSSEAGRKCEQYLQGISNRLKMNLFSSWPGLSPKSGLPDLGFLNLANSGKPEFACHPRLSAVFEAKAWMPGTRPGMTELDERA